VIAQFAQDHAVRVFCAWLEKTHCVLYNLVYRSSSVERSIGLAFTTIPVSAAPLAQPAPLKQAVKPEGTASSFELVAIDRHLAQAAGSRIPGDGTAAGGLPSSAKALALLGVLRRRRRR
jgi:hypothetical protein